jgi:hypothetical protein
MSEIHCRRAEKRRQITALRIVSNNGATLPLSRARAAKACTAPGLRRRACSTAQLVDKQDLTASQQGLPGYPSDTAASNLAGPRKRRCGHAFAPRSIDKQSCANNPRDERAAMLLARVARSRQGRLVHARSSRAMARRTARQTLVRAR